jgi:hypothetical protein
METERQVMTGLEFAAKWQRDEEFRKHHQRNLPLDPEGRAYCLGCGKILPLTADTHTLVIHGPFMPDEHDGKIAALHLGYAGGVLAGIGINVWAGYFGHKGNNFFCCEKCGYVWALQQLIKE